MNGQPLATVSNGGRELATGRFAKGNRIAPGGSALARQQAEMNRKLIAAVSDEDFASIVAAMVKSAKNGSVRGAALLLAYLAGKPAQRIVMDFDLPEADSTPPKPRPVIDLAKLSERERRVLLKLAERASHDQQPT